MNKNNNTLHAEGAEANDRGQSVWSCPYDEDTNQRDMWIAGWHQHQRTKEEWKAQG